MTAPPCTLNCISTGNFLLLGELSAIGAYEKVISTRPATSIAFDLMRILGEHWRSADRLSAFVSGIGGDPATDANDWSAFAGGFKNPLEDPEADWPVRSLKWGEERGRDGALDPVFAERLPCRHDLHLRLPFLLPHEVG